MSVELIKLTDRAEAVELPGATATSAVHLRERAEDWVLCGRDARRAKLLPKFNGDAFEVNDPDARICRTCLRNALKRGDLIARIVPVSDTRNVLAQ